MPLKVLIVPDKFKGTLTAAEAARAIGSGWRKVRPRDSIQLLPMSDGGDGFGAIISALLGARPESIRTRDAAYRPIRARWWWHARTKTAVIESARVIGLAMLPPKAFHPFQLDTFGLEKVITTAARRGARHCLIGIGGSATNDGGFGLARAMGWVFQDSTGKAIDRWTDLVRLERIVAPRNRIWARMKVTVAVDVQNPLLGSRGATRVYGPQKGLRPEDFSLAERCLERLARVAKSTVHRDASRLPGAGAAGGLGFGLLAFLRARAESGADLFSRYAGLEARLRSADLVITGEGAIDRSTLMGKGVGELARLCRSLGVPCLGLAGGLNDRARLRRSFAGVHCLAPDLTTLVEARARPGYWLERLAAQVAHRWPPG